MEEDKHDTWQVCQSLGYYQIVTNPRKLIGQQYTLPQDASFSIEDQIDIYRMRKLQNQFLVKIYDIQRIKANSLCFGQGCVKIVTERIPHRLDEVMNITPNEAIYILYRCLKGFKVICEMLEPVIVDERMIGVDPQGCIKVWINENYSRNYPEAKNKITSVKDKAIQKMVSSIINAVRSYNLPEELTMKLKRILATSMEEHIGIIEKYLKDKDIDVYKIRVKVVKQERSAIQGAIKIEQHDRSNIEVADESSTSMIEGVPHPVAQLVHNIFKPKFLPKLDKSNLIHQKQIRVQRKQEIKRMNQLLVPSARLNPPSRLSPQPQGRPISPHPSNFQMPNLLNGRPSSQLPNMNGLPRPISPRPAQQMFPQQFLQPPQFGMIPGQFGPSRGLSPRPLSPRPLSPNPHFVNQAPVQQVYTQQQVSNQKQQQQQQQPAQINIPAVNVKKQEIEIKSRESKVIKKSTYMAESQCFPLGTMQQNNQYSPQIPFSPQQYQQMIMEQLNGRGGDPFGGFFGRQMMGGPMFNPSQQFQPPNPNNFIQVPQSNMNLMPPPMSHLNGGNIQQIHQEHQFIHGQIMQNLQNHLDGQQGGGFIPTYKRM